ncbi:MAG: hypothetical protein QF827_11035 [Alphaproteobacteria bacterium]|jgi:hypothetical protein|nr:hypothetical protein [Alphaproteobacteria bacterium]
MTARHTADCAARDSVDDRGLDFTLVADVPTVATDGDFGTTRFGGTLALM